MSLVKNRLDWFRWVWFHLPAPSIFPKGHLWDSEAPPALGPFEGPGLQGGTLELARASVTSRAPENSGLQWDACRTGGPRSHCPNWWMHKPCDQLVQDVHLQWEQSSFGRGGIAPCGTSSQGPLSDMEGTKTAAWEGREADTALGAGLLETMNRGFRFPCDLF